VGVGCSGCALGLKARVTFVAAEAEFTPPVIYSVGSREKLVWMVEARLDGGGVLSPGQPVDVTLP
jgi:HlyD family secretion protein